MKSYIFITFEGFTFQPGSESVEPDIENCQVIGFAQGGNEREAFDDLVAESGYLIGTTFDKIRCFELKSKVANDFEHYFYLTDWKNDNCWDDVEKFQKNVLCLTEQEQERLIDKGEVCYYCREPFKECNRIVPGLGVVVGETDVVRYLGKVWHYGCIGDWYKDNKALCSACV